MGYTTKLERVFAGLLGSPSTFHGERMRYFVGDGNFVIVGISHYKMYLLFWCWFLRGKLEPGN